MKLKTLLIVAALTVASPLWAHEVSKGPNGGRVVEAGSYHVELVVKDRAVEVFVTGADDKQVTVAGFKGTAILVVKDKSQRIVLQPVEGTRLSGVSTVALPAEPKGVVQLTTPEGKTAQGKYH